MERGRERREKFILIDRLKTNTAHKIYPKGHEIFFQLVKLCLGDQFHIGIIFCSPVKHLGENFLCPEHISLRFSTSLLKVFFFKKYYFSWARMKTLYAALLFGGKEFIKQRQFRNFQKIDGFKIFRRKFKYKMCPKNFIEAFNHQKHMKFFQNCPEKAFFNFCCIGRKVLKKKTILNQKITSQKLFFLPKVTISNSFRDIDV